MSTESELAASLAESVVLLEQGQDLVSRLESKLLNTQQREKAVILAVGGWAKSYFGAGKQEVAAMDLSDILTRAETESKTNWY
jgi:hypothetical protein